MRAGRFGAWTAAVIGTLAAAGTASAQSGEAPFAFDPSGEGDAGSPPRPLAAPEADATLGDPFDPRLALDLPVVQFVPVGPGAARAAILGWGGPRTVLTVAGVGVSSSLAPSHDAAWLPHLVSGPMRWTAAVGPDPAALRGDALGGRLELAVPEPPFDPYRPVAVEVGARAGFSGDAAAPAGHVRAGIATEDLAATAVLAGAAFGVTRGLSVDADRAGEGLLGNATFDLRVPLSESDRLRGILRLDGASGMVRGGANLGAGFLRVDDHRAVTVETLYRHRFCCGAGLTAWALARTSERSLLAFDPPRDRWSVSDETVWALAGGVSASFGRSWWTLDLSAELRTEGAGAVFSRRTDGSGDPWDDRFGDWAWRPLLDGAGRSGGTIAARAGFRVDPDVDLDLALSLQTTRLYLPIDPYGTPDPDDYAATERWEVEPAATIGVAWRIGDGLRLDGVLETGARPPTLEELSPAGIDPSAAVRFHPNPGLTAERSYGGRLALRLDLGVVELGVDYHAAWIADAVTPVDLAVPDATGVSEARFRNTGAFLQGAALSLSAYAHRDVPLRLLVTSSHGFADDGNGGEVRPADVFPIGVMLEAAYRPHEGVVEAGVYGGYRWRPGSWRASEAEERLGDGCVLGAVRCDRRSAVPLGLFVRWEFLPGLNLVARASDLAFQGDGPSVQGFVSGTF
jgi:hypothetical protein